MEGRGSVRPMEKVIEDVHHRAKNGGSEPSSDQHVHEYNLGVMAGAVARLYDMKEVQQRLKVGRSTASNLVVSGRLRSVRVGRRRLVPESALVEFIESLG
jgi:excisionase family DNA binding protein